MTPEETLQIAAIKFELNVLNALVVSATNGNYSFLIQGEALSGFDTAKDNFKAAVLVDITAARDAKQTEFDDFVGTDV